jgi:uncharacterized protein YciI
MFIITLTYKKSLEIVDQFLVEHRSYLELGYQQNYFIASGPKNPRVGGIILSQLKDRDLLDRIIQQDPFYLHGVADYDVVEFAPVKHHADFAKFI